MSDWTEAQEWEKVWHSNCVNSYGEETKQFTYAKKMGLRLAPNEKTPYNYSFNGESVVDLGCGPYPIFLKCQGLSKMVGVDPCPYPDWVYSRFKEANIISVRISGEEFITNDIFDECWIYNLLQHVQNPELVIRNALRVSKILRLFEWIENGISPGHPQNLTEKDLNKWLGGNGKVEIINENGCVGKCYYGIFKGNHYGE